MFLCASFLLLCFFRFLSFYQMMVNEDEYITKLQRVGHSVILQSETQTGVDERSAMK